MAINGTTATVSAEAGALDSSSKLYLVWDVADNGEVLSSWPEDNRLEYEGTFDGSAATCEFDISSIPVGSAVRAISTVGIKLIDGYVEQTQGTYFDTGVKDSAAYGMEIQLQPVSAVAWGAFAGSAWERFTIGFRGGKTNQFYSRYGGSSSAQGTLCGYNESIYVSTMTTEKHTVRIEPLKITIDGSSTFAFKAGPGGDCLSSVGATVLLGASWNAAGTALYTTSPGSYTGSKWYGARIFDSSENDIANFVPAVFKGTAILYDTVSGEAIEAQGAGAATASYSSVNQVVATDETIASPAAFTGKTAYWTGNGVKTNVNDPDNWNCVDASGATVSDAYPDLQTKVVIQGETDFNIPAGQTLTCHSLDIQNCSLKADCDWSGLAAINGYVGIPVLNYIDAPKGAYIDTGVVPTVKTRVVLDITKQSDYEYWFGALNNPTTVPGWYKIQAFALCHEDGVYIAFNTTDMASGADTSKISNGRHVIDYDKGVYKLDGMVKVEMTSTTANFNRAIYLFAQNRNGSAFSHASQGTIRFHSCKIYDDGTLVRDFVPVKKPDGTVCLFDRKNRVFYENAGTGSFAASEGTTGEKISYYSGEVEGTIDGTVDLAGHALTLAHFAGSGTVTDTAATGGELRVAPGEDETIENAALTLAGSLKLVKNGKGTFLATRMYHSYTGGTLIADGMLKCNAYGRFTPLGQTNAVVAVQKDGVLEMNGNNGYDQNVFILAGGTMQNSGSSANDSYTCWSNIVLTADSSIAINESYGFISGGHGATSLDLGGHTLHVSVADGKTFWVYGTTIENGGTLDVAGGCAKFGRSDKSNTAVNAQTANITVNAKIEAAYGDIPVNNYTAQYNTDGNAGDYKFLVYDVFKPAAGGYFHGCEMQDGSTIDFTGRTAALNAVSSFSGGNKTLSFADGTITIKIDPKADWIKTLAKAKDKLVDWSDSTSKPGEGVKFALDAGGDTRYKIKRSADGNGLELYLTPGFAVIVR